MTQQHIELTAVGQGYYRVFVDNVERSKHIAEREASESAIKLKNANPASSVYYDHDYHVRVDLVNAPVVVPPVVPVPEPEPEPPVVPDPVVPPTPTGRITADDFELIGGWLLMQDFAKPGLAIDFQGMRAFSGVHAHHSGINEYPLPPMGIGSDKSQWPQARKSQVHSQFWPQLPGESTQANGMAYRDGVLSVSARAWYTFEDRNPHIIAHKNLATGEVATTNVPVSTQQYGGGFIKGHPDGLMLGCGGYVSGGHSFAGPTAANMDGTPLLSQVHFTDLDFDRREKRPPTAWPKDGVDNFMALNPRDGVGAWGSDSVSGGGVWTDQGLLYWPNLSTGEGEYRDAAVRFTGGHVPWLYSYDPQSFQSPKWSEWPHGVVIGSDIGPDGIVYLLIREAFQVNPYLVVNAIAAFRIKK
jgi:hypothetical protein